MVGVIPKRWGLGTHWPAGTGKSQASWSPLLFIPGASSSFWFLCRPFQTKECVSSRLTVQTNILENRQTNQQNSLFYAFLYFPILYFTLEQSFSKLMLTDAEFSFLFLFPVNLLQAWFHCCLSTGVTLGKVASRRRGLRTQQREEAVAGFLRVSFSGSLWKEKF